MLLHYWGRMRIRYIFLVVFLASLYGAVVGEMGGTKIPSLEPRSINPSKRTLLFDCGPGKYWEFTWGEPPCKICPQGFECDGRQKQKCSKSFYAESRGKSRCTECPSGRTTAKRGSKKLSDCQPCKPGTYRKDGTSGCEPCIPGTYSSSGASKCTECQAGRYAPSTGTKDECTKCPAGRFSKLPSADGCDSCTQPLVATSKGSQECVPCPLGTEYSSASECTQCPSGRYRSSIEQARCLICPKGYKCPEVDSEPIPCEYSETHYCPSGREQEAKVEEGYYLTSIHEQTSAFTNQEACPAGQFCRNGVRAPCEVGSFQPHTGQNSCDKCPPGSYQDEQGQSRCKDCTNGEESKEGSRYCAPGFVLVEALQGGKEEGFDEGDRIEITFTAAVVSKDDVGLDADGLPLPSKALRQEEVDALLVFATSDHAGNIVRNFVFANYTGLWRSPKLLEITFGSKHPGIADVDISVGEEGRLRLGIRPDVLRKWEYRDDPLASFMNDGRTIESMRLTKIVRGGLLMQSCLIVIPFPNPRWAALKVLILGRLK